MTNVASARHILWEIRRTRDWLVFL